MRFGIVVVLVACTNTETPTPDAPPMIMGYHSIATGNALTCDLDNGVAWCWGQLGDNSSTTMHAVPVEAGGTIRFTQLSAFGRVICGVGTDGKGYCWGPNTQAQLGLGTQDEGSKTPVVVGGGRPFRTIYAGDPTSCGITPDGSAFCWGDNNSGQVGSDNGPTVIQSPVGVAGGRTFASLSISESFVCGTTTQGEAYCWGSNTYGQLATGAPISGQSTDVSRVPSLVVGGHTWRKVTTGQFYACGLTTAGAAYCWGQNNYQFGDGGMTSSSTPVAVSGGHVFRDLDAGRDFTCGITMDNRAYCWGSNNLGQLGVANPADLSRVPVAVGGSLELSEIAASDGEHTCAINVARTAVYCWGRNDVGQLGNNSPTGSNTQPTPTPAAVVGQSR